MTIMPTTIMPTMIMMVALSLVVYPPTRASEDPIGRGAAHPQRGIMRVLAQEAQMGPVAPGVEDRLRELAVWYQIRDVDGTLARAPPLVGLPGGDDPGNRRGGAAGRAWTGGKQILALGSGEFKQGSDVVVIGGSEGGDIPRPRLADIGQADTPPSEGVPPEPDR